LLDRPTRGDRWRAGPVSRITMYVLGDRDTISVEAVVSTTVPTTMARTNGPGSISR
jgi:hypothetical protein